MRLSERETVVSPSTYHDLFQKFERSIEVQINGSSWIDCHFEQDA